MNYDMVILKKNAVTLFKPMTEAAKQWVAANVQPDALKLGEALVVDARYADSVAFALTNAGLTVQTVNK